ncbi:MAG: SDR family NAD(P)-dependent oxidoreductase [Acidimicrobiales bacterium]
MIDANGFPQSVLVLGGGSDIAAAITERLVRARCDRVVLAGHRFSTMEQVRERLQSISAAKVDLVHFDLANHQEIAGFVDQTFDEFGPIDMVIVAGGLLGDQQADESDPEAVLRIGSVNYLGTTVALTACANRLVRQGFGSLVILSSVAGERVRRSNYVYGASKAGLDGFALGMADALRDRGITVVVVRPGFVSTKMTKGMAQAPLSTTPDAVAKDVISAIEKKREIVWSPAPLRVVMAIYRHLPRAIARRLPF